VTTALEELRDTVNNYRHQDIPLQSIKDDLNVLLDEAENMNGVSQITHETLSGTSVLVSNGGEETLPWTSTFGPDTLLDRSSPTQPVVIEAGVYAIHADTIQDDAMTVGGFYRATLTVGGGDQVVSVSPPSNADEQFPQASTLVIVRYLTPSDTIELVIENHDGVNDINFGQAGSIIQRIS